MAGSVETSLDRVQALREEGDLTPVDVEGTECRTTAEIAMVLGDRSLRDEHRARIYEDLQANRKFIEQIRDPRLVDLIRWSEHVETLYGSFKRGRPQEFHFVRALEATCRRCGFELLPVLGRMTELGKAWSGRDFDETYKLLSPDFIQVDATDEAADELGT